MTALVLVVYIIGVLAAWPIMTRLFYHDIGCDDTSDYIFAIFIGLCWSLLWPLGSLVAIAFPLKWLFFPHTFKEDQVKEKINQFIRRP